MEVPVPATPADLPPKIADPHTSGKPLTVAPEPPEVKTLTVTAMDEVIAFSHTGSLTSAVAEVIRAWYSGADGSSFTANTLLRSPQVRDHDVIRDKSPSAQIKTVNGILRTLVHRKVIYQAGDRSRFGETKYRVVQPVTVERMGTHFFGDGHDHGPEPALDLAPAYAEAGVDVTDPDHLRESPTDAARHRVFTPEAVAQAQEAADYADRRFVGIGFDTELVAMQMMVDALTPLTTDQARRALRWAAARYLSPAEVNMIPSKLEG
jgi:hypothetical protein